MIQNLATQDQIKQLNSNLTNLNSAFVTNESGTWIKTPLEAITVVDKSGTIFKNVKAADYQLAAGNSIVSWTSLGTTGTNGVSFDKTKYHEVMLIFCPNGADGTYGLESMYLPIVFAAGVDTFSKKMTDGTYTTIFNVGVSIKGNNLVIGCASNSTNPYYSPALYVYVR